MKPYFYIIQHVASGKYYAGSKYSKDAEPSKLLTEDGYKTSSKIVNAIIKKEGLSSFVINRIRSFDDKKSAYDYETRFLKKVDAANNECFINFHNNNITLGEENEDGEFLLHVSLGGKVQGKRNAESGHMLRIREMVDEEKRVAKVKQSLSTNKTGCFLDENLHKKSASLGGKVQGKRNAESGHLNEISKQYWENVKLGKIERKRKIWCNNGVEEKQIDVDSHIPHSFVKGRLKK